MALEKDRCQNTETMEKKSTFGRWRGVNFQNSVSEPVRCRGVVVAWESIHWKMDRSMGKRSLQGSGRCRGVVVKGGPLYTVLNYS